MLAFSLNDALRLTGSRMGSPSREMFAQMGARTPKVASAATSPQIEDQPAQEQKQSIPLMDMLGGRGSRSGQRFQGLAQKVVGAIGLTQELEEGHSLI